MKESKLNITFIIIIGILAGLIILNLVYLRMNINAYQEMSQNLSNAEKTQKENSLYSEKINLISEARSAPK